MRVIGVDVGGSRVKSVSIGSNAKITAFPPVPTPPDVGGVIDLLSEIVERNAPVDAVGVAVAGLVDRARGVLLWGPHVPGTRVPISERLAGRVGVPVTVGNDADMATLAEARSRPDDDRSLLMVALGTGIGMGFLAAGEWMPADGHAGEVGHVIVDPDGAPCPCGRRGCWETKVSGRQLDSVSTRLGYANGRELVDAALGGAPSAQEGLRSPMRWLSWGIESLVLTLAPEVVILGGSVGTHASPLFIPAIIERLKFLPGGAYRNSIAVEASILGTQAGAIGAAMAAEKEVGR